MPGGLHLGLDVDHVREGRVVRCRIDVLDRTPGLRSCSMIEEICTKP